MKSFVKSKVTFACKRKEFSKSKLNHCVREVIFWNFSSHALQSKDPMTISECVNVIRDKGKYAKIESRVP